MCGESVPEGDGVDPTIDPTYPPQGTMMSSISLWMPQFPNYLVVDESIGQQRAALSEKLQMHPEAYAEQHIIHACACAYLGLVVYTVY